MFGRNIKPISFLYSGLLTVGFSMIVNLFMHQKLKKIDMVEECGIAIKQEKALDGDNLVLRLKKLRHQNTGQGFL